MKRWANLSTEARDAVIRESLIDVVMFWAALIVAAIMAAIWKWS